MNATSSRAHTILTLKVQREEAVEGGSKHFISSEINLIDLAGSERSKKTGAEGESCAKDAPLGRRMALEHVTVQLCERVDRTTVAPSNERVMCNSQSPITPASPPFERRL